MNAPDIQNSRHAAPYSESEGRRGGFFYAMLSGVAARRCNALMDQMHAGIHAGSIEGSLPDGTRRMLGGRMPGPTAEMNIRSWRALIRIAWAGSVGLYEGWAAGEWDSPDPVQIFDLFVRNRTSLGDTARGSYVARIAGKILHTARRNSKSGSRRNIAFHYDMGNDFYAAWLDDGMTYSSALFAQPFSDAQTLADAQDAKNAAMIERLQLNDGDSLLEIGCGWGGLAEAAIRHRDLNYHGLTLSVEQKAYADTRLLAAGFAGQAEVSITDYRDAEGTYDAIASVEMAEAVGQAYWPDYLDAVSALLKTGGRAGIQFIRIEDDIFEAYASSVDFIQRYIFPGGMLISQSRFRTLAEVRGLIWTDQTDFGMHYAETLRRWRVQFDAAVQQGSLPTQFDEKFIRLWRFYLMYCEGGFRGGGINVSQVTLIKTDVN
jgi:cyclopropane-fatty-acyl-phospholipid synthase